MRIPELNPMPSETNIKLVVDAEDTISDLLPTRYKPRCGLGVKKSWFV